MVVVSIVIQKFGLKKSKHSIAYITHYPCINCMKIMSASGIIDIRYINDYKNDQLVEHFSKLWNVKIEKI